MRLLFKFRETTPAGERRRVLTRLRRQGVEAVEPLFPEVSDEELAAVFVLDAADEAGERLLARLKKDRAIEYAEPEVRRRLVS